MVCFPANRPMPLNNTARLRKIFRAIPHREITGNAQELSQIKRMSPSSRTSCSRPSWKARSTIANDETSNLAASLRVRSLGDEGSVGLVVDERVDGAGRAAAEFSAIAVELLDREGRVLVGPQA